MTTGGSHCLTYLLTPITPPPDLLRSIPKEAKYRHYGDWLGGQWLEGCWWWRSRQPRETGLYDHKYVHGSCAHSVDTINNNSCDRRDRCN